MAADNTTSIFLYTNGDCGAKEFIETGEEIYSLNNDGTVHYIKFVEGSPTMRLGFDAFYVSELLEGIVVHLTDESDEFLLDESENYLTLLI